MKVSVVPGVRQLASLRRFVEKREKIPTVLIVSTCILAFVSCASPESKKREDILPEFAATAFGGAMLVSGQLRNSTFVIFIGSTETYHTDLLEKVYRNYSENLNIIVFAGEPSLLASLHGRFPKAWVIDDSQGFFAGKFDAKSCCGRFFIYDSNKQLAAVGNNTVFYEEGVRSILRRLVEHVAFDISMLIPGQRLSRSPAFREVWDRLSVQGKREYVIFMLSDVCGACPVAKTISELSAALIKQRDIIGTLFLFSQDFSDTDIRNFRAKWPVPWPCVRAEGALALLWNDLMHDFSREELNQILLLADSSGALLATNREAFKRLVE
jgi:hypothetical protein